VATQEFTVRIVKPSSKPFVPKTRTLLKTKGLGLLERMVDFFVGSGIGFVAGTAIFIMLKHFGLELSGTESTVIIALPSLLGLFTSLVIF